ncbi:MAG: ABC transporter ATP-binding protein [Treponema sp.]|nr:ABC transporter ATP-binding protein [Treponema sp.]
MEHSLCAKIKTAAYGARPVLQGVDVTFSSGQLVCLCGPNGSGKSTLLSLMAGLCESSLTVEGQVLINNQNLSLLKAKEKARLIAYMEQSAFSAWDFTVFDFVLQGRYAYTSMGFYSQTDKDFALECLSLLGIAAFADKKIMSISGGEFQKVRLARALCQNPTFLLLDEPASNLDFVYEPSLLKVLKELAAKKNIGVILSMHDVNLAARFADKILLLGPQKSPLFGPVNDILNEENLEKTFGVAFECQKIKYFQSLQ